MLTKCALVLFLVGALTTFAQAEKSKTGMPRCPRPRDFSQGRPVSDYEACMKRQRTYCADHDGDQDCAQIKPPQAFDPHSRSDQADPSKRCSVQKDGSYVCLQDPLRFTGNNEEEEAPGTPASSPTTSDVPLENANPAAPGTGAGPGVLPPGAIPPGTGIVPSNPAPEAPLPVVLPPHPQK
jgi:hypothetical protein